MAKYLAFIILLPMLAIAQDYTDLGKQLGESIKTHTSTNSMSTDNALNYEGTNVPGKEFHDDGSVSSMENAANIESSTSETGQYINEASSTRPPVIFDLENDPLFKRFDEVEEKAHSLTDTYSGCVELPVGNEDVTDVIPDSCIETGTHSVINYTCKKDVLVTCQNEKAGTPRPLTVSDFTVTGDDGMPVSKIGTNTFRFGPSGKNNRGGTCEWYYNTIKFYVKNKEEIYSIKLSGGRYDDWLFVRYNWNDVFEAIGNSYYNEQISDSAQYKCERGNFSIPTSKVKDMKSHIRNGWNYIHVRNLVSGTGQARLELEVILLEPCDSKTEYSTTCPAGKTEEEGEYLSSTCSEPGETRYIGIFPIYKSCWGWDREYKTYSDPIYSREPKCETLLQQGCTTNSSQCLSFDETLGYCNSREHFFNCYDTHAAEYVTMCGDTLICAEGECGKEYQTYTDATDDFKKATASFEAAKAVGGSYSEDLSIFTGKAYTCSKDNLWNTRDCCKDSGWANGSITQCNTNEKLLGVAREDERAFQTHYWEWKKKEDITGTLLEKWSYRSFCVYPSKLGRIIMKQAYEQLGHTVMGHKTPNCRGLTAEELELLDFEAIDLSEFYDDVMEQKDGASVPAIDALQQRLEMQLKAAGGS